MDLGLKDKVVIVTAGASNIGRAISLTFGEEGANVIIADIDEKQGQKVADLIKSKGGKAKVSKTDVTKYEEVEAMAKAVVDEFGRIDVLVNNLGWDDFTPFMDTKPNWEKLIDLNYRHYLNCLHVILPYMMEKKYGHIVNVGSDAGRIGEFRENVYAGCKAGVIGLSKAVAREVGRYGININVVCPGATMPDDAVEDCGEYSMFNPESETWKKLGALFSPDTVKNLAKASYPLRPGGVPSTGRAEDTANAVAFLSSDRAEFITGQTISASGGYSMAG
jgi:2-hydroxycyclohexanecarboxyl-CoA dehydrogenase